MEATWLHFLYPLWVKYVYFLWNDDTISMYEKHSLVSIFLRIFFFRGWWFETVCWRENRVYGCNGILHFIWCNERETKLFLPSSASPLLHQILSIIWLSSMLLIQSNQAGFGKSVFDRIADTSSRLLLIRIIEWKSSYCHIWFSHCKSRLMKLNVRTANQTKLSKQLLSY